MTVVCRLAKRSTMTYPFVRTPPWRYLLQLPVGSGVIELRADIEPVGDAQQQYFNIKRATTNFQPDHILGDICGPCSINDEDANGDTCIDHASKIYLHQFEKEYVFVDCAVSDNIMRQVGLNESYAVAHILGEGSFGGVHLCFGKRSAEVFALKISRHATNRERDIVRRLDHPGNILLHHPDPYTLVKVADFGISKSELLHSTMDSAAGTPCFMAPEILYGEDSYTKKVDIWSLGVILYMSLTGCIAIARDGKVSLTLPTFQFSARNLLKKMLQINPKKRPSIDEVAQHKWLKKSRVRGRIDAMKMKLRDGLIPQRKTAAKHTTQTTHFRKGEDIQDLFSSATKFQDKQKSRPSSPTKSRKTRYGVIIACLGVGIIILITIM